MTTADIFQIVISFLTLITSIVVSISIYNLQRKHEKEIREIEGSQKRREFEEKAEKFIFDNEDEKKYLPLCVIANNLHRHEKHNRKIYNNFCRCSVDLQNEILKQAGFNISIISSDKWVNSCFEKLEKDIEKYQLGKDVLYDGAKYFHRGFERYRDKKFDMEYEHIINPIYPSLSAFGKDGKIDIGSYIDDYFDYIMGNRSDMKNQKNIFKPIDFIWERQQLATCDEKIVCKWIMVLVKNIVINIHDKIVFKDDTDTWTENLECVASDTYEDEYYEIMYWLYATYYVPTNKIETM